MTVASFLAALVSVAPPVATAPPAPPVPAIVAGPMTRYAGSAAAPRTTQTLSIQLRQDGRVLWSGEMTRASDGMASYTQQLRESRACGADEPLPGFARAGVRATSLTITISQDYPSADGAVRVSVERSRPFGDDAGCPDGGTSSTVRFEARTILPQGKPITLSGEGGLSATIMRR